MPRQPCGLSPALGQQFCGPTAIAAITGYDPATVEAAVVAHRKVAGTPRRNVLRGAVVRSMWSSEVDPVLAKLGWRVVEYTAYSAGIAGTRMLGPTFAQWQRKTGRARGTYVVLLTGHFVAVSGHWFADTKHRQPIALRKAPHRRLRVARAWRVEPVEA